jgi:hypothetical protein
LNWKLCPGKKKAIIIRVRLLKRKRSKVKIDPKLGGQWKEKEKEKVPMLGGQWKEKEKVPMFGGQWNVPSLVANGR